MDDKELEEESLYLQIKDWTPWTYRAYFHKTSIDLFRRSKNVIDTDPVDSHKCSCEVCPLEVPCWLRNIYPNCGF